MWFFVLFRVCGTSQTVPDTPCDDQWQQIHLSRPQAQLSRSTFVLYYVRFLGRSRRTYVRNQLFSRYFRKTSPSVALTGKGSKNERSSMASRSFIFWPIGKIRLQKKVGSKKFEIFVKFFRFQIWKFWNLKSENFEIWKLKILKSEIWKFWNLESENFEDDFFWKQLICCFSHSATCPHPGAPSALQGWI